jgi:X-Pro dipeptidyl-peptidase (S15 family)
MNAPVSIDRAWNVFPDEYVDQRPVEFGLPVAKSHYVTMRDGCRIAVDIYVPRPPSGAVTSRTFPAIALFTPYCRRFKLRPAATGEANPNTGKFRDFFVPRGYAVDAGDIERDFPDRDRIFALGCSSILNMPVRWKGEVLGQINPLHEARHFGKADLPMVEAMVQIVVPAFLIAAEHTPGGCR